MACDRPGFAFAKKRHLKGSVLSSIDDNLVSGSRDPANVRAMFGAISRRYDLANHILSCGFDFHWRERVADLVARSSQKKILNLATGTGELALAIQSALPTAQIVPVDF